MKDLIERTVKKITDYGYNSEYGFYNDWADGVRPILEQALKETIEFEREKMRKGLERIKLDMDVVICYCGEPYKDSDPADLINALLLDLKNN